MELRAGSSQSRDGATLAVLSDFHYFRLGKGGY